MPNNSSATADREVLTTRVINAPRAKVFRAFTEAEPLSSWWGPNGFTNTFETLEPKPGGDWRFVMHGPDGRSYPNHNRFAEIVPNERIVLDHLSAPEFRVTVTLSDEGAGTLVSFHMLWADASVLKSVRHIIVPANEENFDRLTAALAKIS